MKNYKDICIEDKLADLSLEIKIKRDSAKTCSEEKKYYRNLSKHLDKTFKSINDQKDNKKEDDN